MNGELTVPGPWWLAPLWTPLGYLIIGTLLALPFTTWWERARARIAPGASKLPPTELTPRADPADMEEPYGDPEGWAKFEAAGGWSQFDKVEHRDIHIREEKTDSEIGPIVRIEFAIFCDGQFVQSVIVSRERAAAIQADLGRILEKIK